MPSFTSSDGLNIAYTDDGAGKPVLCLSGLTRTGRDFDEVVAAFPDRRVIRMDYRGRGASDWDPNWQNYHPMIEGRDAVELLDHLGIERAAVIGTSRGGVIGMLLAATAKARLTGLMLVDIGPVMGDAGLDVIRDFIGVPPPFPDYAAAAAAHALTPGFANVPPERWMHEVRKYYVETDGGLKLSYDPALRESVLAAFDGPKFDGWPLFDALSGLPVGEIWGVNSTQLSAETVAEMQARRPDLILARVPDRAHVPFLDEPESIAALRAFLELAA